MSFRSDTSAPCETIVLRFFTVMRANHADIVNNSSSLRYDKCTTTGSWRPWYDEMITKNTTIVSKHNRILNMH